MTQIEITLRKSAIGEKADARRTLTALGIRRTGQRVAHTDSATLRGMMRKVAHLIDVREVSDAGKA